MKGSNSHSQLQRITEIAKHSQTTIERNIFCDNKIQFTERCDNGEIGGILTAVESKLKVVMFTVRTDPTHPAD